MLILLVGLMFVMKLGIIFKVGLIVIAALIWYEHTLVKADNFTNVPVAFFNVNAAVSLSMLAFTVIGYCFKLKVLSPWFKGWRRPLLRGRG